MRRICVRVCECACIICTESNRIASTNSEWELEWNVKMHSSFDYSRNLSDSHTIFAMTLAHFNKVNAFIQLALIPSIIRFYDEKMQTKKREHTQWFSVWVCVCEREGETSILSVIFKIYILWMIASNLDANFNQIVGNRFLLFIVIAAMI